MAPRPNKVLVAPCSLAGSGLSAHTPPGHAFRSTTQKDGKEIISLHPFWTLVRLLGTELSFNLLTQPEKDMKMNIDFVKEPKPCSVKSEPGLIITLAKMHCQGRRGHECS